MTDTHFLAIAEFYVAMIQNLKDKDTSADSLNEDNGKKYILNFLTIFSTYAQLPFFFDFKEWIQMLFLFLSLVA